MIGWKLQQKSQPVLTSSLHVIWLVVIFYFHPEPWGRWTHFDEHMFERGWNHNHQLVMVASFFRPKCFFCGSSWGLVHCICCCCCTPCRLDAVKWHLRIYTDPGLHVWMFVSFNVDIPTDFKSVNTLEVFFLSFHSENTRYTQLETCDFWARSML